MSFHKGENIYENIGIGRISQAEPIYGLFVVFRNKQYLISGKDLHSILKALTEKEILWGLIDSYLPVSPQEGDKFELHFLKNLGFNSENGIEYRDLHSLRGKNINYCGKLYIIPPHDNS